jgi:hypothetical protein
VPTHTRAHRQRIVLMPLSELLKRRSPENAKEHDIDLIRESIREHGLVDLPGIDDTSGKIARGHGRAEALEAMRTEDEPPPLEVKLRKGEWLVPVMVGVKFKDKRQLFKYQLVDNKATERGGWNHGKVGKVLHFIGEKNLIGTGIDPGDMVRFVKGSKATMPDIHETYAIIVECKGEKQQATLLKRFQAMGLTVRALVS